MHDPDTYPRANSENTNSCSEDTSDYQKGRYSTKIRIGAPVIRIPKVYRLIRHIKGYLTFWLEFYLWHYIFQTRKGDILHKATNHVFWSKQGNLWRKNTTMLKSENNINIIIMIGSYNNAINHIKLRQSKWSSSIQISWKPPTF